MISGFHTHWKTCVVVVVVVVVLPTTENDNEHWKTSFVVVVVSCWTTKKDNIQTNIGRHYILVVPLKDAHVSCDTEGVAENALKRKWIGWYCI